MCHVLKHQFIMCLQSMADGTLPYLKVLQAPMSRMHQQQLRSCLCAEPPRGVPEKSFASEVISLASTKLSGG